MDWLAFYSLSPWGESRADRRQEALILTLAAPLMGEGYRIPSPRFPYSTDDDDSPIDYGATMDAVADYQARFYGKDSSQPQHPDRGECSEAQGGSGPSE